MTSLLPRERLEEIRLQLPHRTMSAQAAQEVAALCAHISALEALLVRCEESLMAFATEEGPEQSDIDRARALLKDLEQIK